MGLKGIGGADNEAREDEVAGGGRVRVNNEEYARRGMAEWHRQRDEYYAQREQWQQRPFQQDEAEAQRGAVSPLGGQAKGDGHGGR